jgi:glutathione S-transferase
MMASAVPLKLYYHPLASFCWKVLVPLYENATPFEPHRVDLMDPVAREEFKRLWPLGKFPVLRDEARDVTLPESSIIVEYLARHHPGPVELLPSDPEAALETRLKDRFYDLYVHEPMQKIVTDRLRPAGHSDAHGVERAKELLASAYAIIDREMSSRTWAAGEAFTLADCANRVLPLGAAHPRASAYLGRLLARPSFARVVDESQAYQRLFPA